MIQVQAIARKSDLKTKQIARKCVAKYGQGAYRLSFGAVAELVLVLRDGELAHQPLVLLLLLVRGALVVVEDGVRVADVAAVGDPLLVARR
jgi:hypothetical protein